ncbi:MAG: putative ABC transporter permease [Oscillospiraceae bacterium]|nr:putative ABC transporter permease [Oscillospiraceae bacterium]
MSIFLQLAFLFFVGSVSGWVLELLFRRFFSRANPERKWINPGFCTGPYLPLYGFGLCLLYLIASLEKLRIIEDPLWNSLLLFTVMAVCMTVIEYIAGILSLKLYKVRLWDYREEWGNIQGIICPKFSLIWAALGAVYYFLIHPHILDAIGWLSRNLAFSFVIGLFFGVFLIDVVHSLQLVAKLKKFAEENDVIVRYETLKTNIRAHRESTAQKYRFFQPFQTDKPISEHLKEMRDIFESRIRKIKR